MSVTDWTTIPCPGRLSHKACPWGHSASFINLCCKRTVMVALRTKLARAP